MKQNLPVEEFTTPGAYSVSPSESIDNVKSLMIQHGFRHVPVMENNKAVGIISDRDLWISKSDGQEVAEVAKDIMTPEPYVVSPETPMEEVAFELSKNKIGCAVVQKEDEDFLGIFTSTDALNALIEVLRGQTD